MSFAAKERQKMAFRRAASTAPEMNPVLLTPEGGLTDLQQFAKLQELELRMGKKANMRNMASHALTILDLAKERLRKQMEGAQIPGAASQSKLAEIYQRYQHLTRRAQDIMHAMGDDNNLAEDAHHHGDADMHINEEAAHAASHEVMHELYKDLHRTVVDHEQATSLWSKDLAREARQMAMNCRN